MYFSGNSTPHMTLDKTDYERIMLLNEKRIRWIQRIRLLPFISIKRVKVYAWHSYETLEALKLRNVIHCLQTIVVMNVAPVEGKFSFLPESATEFKIGSWK